MALYAKEFKEQGIPNVQRQGWATPYDEGLSKWMNYVTPYGFGGFEKRIHTALLSQGEDREAFKHPRNDLWALHLGLPARDGTLAISSNLPPQLQDQEALVFKMTNDANGNESLVNTMVRLKLGGAVFKKDRDGRDRKVVVDQSFGTPAHLIAAWDKEGKTLPTYVRKLWTDADRKGRTLYWRPGSLANFTVYMGQDEKGRYVEYVDEWDLDAPITEESSKWIDRGLALAKRFSLFHDGLKQVVARVEQIGLPKKHHRVLVDHYYGKPPWISDRIYYDLERVKKAIKLENELLGLAADDYLMKESVKGLLRLPSAEKGIAMNRLWLYDNLEEGSRRRELAELDPFYQRR